MWRALLVVIVASGCHHDVSFTPTRPYPHQRRASVFVTWVPPSDRDFVEVAGIEASGRSFRDAVQKAVDEAGRNGCEILLIRDEHVEQGSEDGFPIPATLDLTGSCYVRAAPPIARAGPRCGSHVDCPANAYCDYSGYCAPR